MNTLQLIDLTHYELTTPDNTVRLTIEILPGGYAYQAAGTVDGRRIAYSEYGFGELENLLVSLRRRDTGFFYGIDIPEVTERDEVESFRHIGNE